jgi:pilus assembly protein CpaB
VQVVVAAVDIPVGARIGENDVKLAPYPQENLPQGCYRQKADVVGQGVVQPIAKGEFVLPSKLAGKDVTGLAGLIPPGMRAVSVRVNEVVSVAGFVLPGTRVDVLLTGNPGSGVNQTTTVLKNIRVLATGQKLERNSPGDPENAAVITLLVSPDDAQKLALASTQGRIQLALRNPLDSREPEVGAVGAIELYRGAPTPVVRPATGRPRAKPMVTVPSSYTIEVIRGNTKEETKF